MISTYGYVKGPYLPVDGASFRIMKAGARFNLGFHPKYLHVSWAELGLCSQLPGKSLWREPVDTVK
jgi:hypothetical protein